MNDLIVVSSAFIEGEFIPQKYTCEGIDVNPPLKVINIPKEAKCLALIVEDPDVKSGLWTHWMVWDIPLDREIKEDSKIGIEGMNSFLKMKYMGPCPPDGVHRYYFRFFALSKMLKLAPGSSRETFEKALKGKILSEGKLLGKF